MSGNPCPQLKVDYVTRYLSLKKTHTDDLSMKRCLMVLHAAILILTGCSAKSGGFDLPKASVSVSVHGVNYTGDPFDYGVADPNSDDKVGVGEHISPYSAGGTVCCFNLPKKWKPGIKAKVYTSYWVKDEKNPDGHDIKKTEIVELPRYADGEAGELWVIRTAEGGLELVSSNFQPDHPQWPGKVKGWPEPSLEFRRERWALLHDQAVHYVESYRHSLKELEEKPEQTTKEFWDSDKKYARKEVQQFSGANDPRYAVYLKAQLLEGLKRSEERVQDSLRRKP